MVQVADVRIGEKLTGRYLYNTPQKNRKLYFKPRK
jgi:hypothetical protein